jgi:ABC-2 type transport system ATP-binding protein
MKSDSGSVNVLGVDAAKDPQAIQSRISYMPQKFGLYDDLTVQENLDLYSDLHGVSKEEKRTQYTRLMEMTGLDPFQKRLAGKLSGGMKQKLGLACTLVRSPELLLLDEPTVGVDPLSRRELWEIIHQLVAKGLTVLLSTSYLDEAAACERILVLNEGKKLAEGPPSDVSRMALGRTFLAHPPEGMKPRDFQARFLDEPDIIDAVPEGGQVRLVSQAGSGLSGSVPFGSASVQPTPARLEDGFMVLMKQAQGSKPIPKAVPPPEGSAIAGTPNDSMVEVHDLDRSFGKFVAVDHVSFTVKRGEIFGLLGPNGAGKTTTFRMLCGLLPPSGGTLTVAGVDVCMQCHFAQKRYDKLSSPRLFKCLPARSTPREIV